MSDFQPDSVSETLPTKPQKPILPIIFGTIGAACVGLIGIMVAGRAFVFEVRYLPSNSMRPTLQINDRLLINKLTYRSQAPQRGDIVLFRPTEKLEKENYHDAFLKRIIGLPGESIEVKQGKVFINKQPLSEPYIAEAPQYQYGPVTVAQDSYLVLGDNRNNSYDSHYWGFVQRNLIIGKATQILLPPERNRPLK